EALPYNHINQLAGIPHGRDAPPALQLHYLILQNKKGQGLPVLLSVFITCRKANGLSGDGVDRRQWRMKGDGGRENNK
ncbi:MAG: hypothetical protein IKV52_00260, partial [Oscillospiraceae bacterium]|nr:hypothetical protein [Oscillospiraceae bacterium]